MNVNMQGIKLFNTNNMLKSTQDRLERLTKRDNQVAFFEQQKENLKYMQTDSLEDITRKLELLHGYDDQITAAKTEYNNSQMFHLIDEAMERGEKIAEEAEKNAPKTPEERREDIIEEATGVDMDGGMISEMMDEMSEIAEEMTEKASEEIQEMTDQLEEIDVEEQIPPAEDEIKALSNEEILAKYKRIDYRI